MARHCRKYVRRTGGAGGPCCRDLTARVHDAAVTHGSKEKRHRQVSAEDGCTQIRVRCRDRVSGTKCDGVECAAILAHRHFGLGSSVDVVEYDFWNSTACETTEIVDIDDAGRSYGARGDGHAASFP